MFNAQTISLNFVFSPYKDKAGFDCQLTDKQCSADEDASFVATKGRTSVMLFTAVFTEYSFRAHKFSDCFEQNLLSLLYYCRCDSLLLELDAGVSAVW